MMSTTLCFPCLGLVKEGCFQGDRFLDLHFFNDLTAEFEEKRLMARCGFRGQELDDLVLALDICVSKVYAVFNWGRCQSHRAVSRFLIKDTPAFIFPVVCRFG